MLSELTKHDGYWTWKADGWFYSVEYHRCPECGSDELTVKMLTWEDTGAGNLGDLPVFYCAQCKAQSWPDWAGTMDEASEQLTYLAKLF